MEKEEGVLVIRRIHVLYHLRADSAHGETIRRVHGMHHDHCPVYRTIHRCVEISTEVEILEDPA